MGTGYWDTVYMYRPPPPMDCNQGGRSRKLALLFHFKEENWLKFLRLLTCWAAVCACCQRTTTGKVYDDAWWARRGRSEICAHCGGGDIKVVFPISDSKLLWERTRGEFSWISIGWSVGLPLDFFPAGITSWMFVLPGFYFHLKWRIVSSGRSRGIRGILQNDGYI